jgi:hypothetical protein
MGFFIWVLIVLVAAFIIYLIKEFKKTPEELKRDTEKQLWKARGKPLEGTFELPKDLHEKIEDNKPQKKLDKK